MGYRTAVGTRVHLLTLVLFAMLSLVSPEGARAQFSFCDLDATPGVPFAGYAGQQWGLSGPFLMRIAQSGDFQIHNLQAGWDGISIGGYQLVEGNNTVTLSGTIPASATPGQSATVSFSVYDLRTRLVLFGTKKIYAAGVSGGWQKVWESAGGAGLDAYPIVYYGDFDGDGAEEILGVGGTAGANDWMTMFHYGGGDWQWGWSNYGNPNVGAGIYPYRDRLVVGDFDGDGRDEVLGTSGWMTMFHYDNGDWHWGWSNYGNTSAGDGIYPYREHLLPGDYDGDGKDELLGTGGWITMFHYDNGDWHWGWSDYGATGVPLPNLRAGDFDADGKDEVLWLEAWAVIYHFENNTWSWNWSTGGGNSFAGWTYPLAIGDRVLVGDLKDNDPNQELIFIQTGSHAAWSTTMNLAGGIPAWGWSNYGSPPYLHDWSLRSSPGFAATYFVIQADANDPAYLFARRPNCTQNPNTINAMYKLCHFGGC